MYPVYTYITSSCTRIHCTLQLLTPLPLYTSHGDNQISLFVGYKSFKYLGQYHLCYVIVCLLNVCIITLEKNANAHYTHFWILLSERISLNVQTHYCNVTFESQCTWQSGVPSPLTLLLTDINFRITYMEQRIAKYVIQCTCVYSRHVF